MANFNFNKVIIGGRLTAAPELKQTPQGVSVMSFSVAVNRKIDNKATDFIDVVAWRKTAEFISKYFTKGSSICITGELQKREWTDNNGNKRYAVEVVADEAYFVDSKSEGAQTAPPPAYNPYAAAPQFNNSAPQFEELPSDESLPF